MSGDFKPNYAPVYCAALYPGLAKIFFEHGYALAVHGSLARDFDLIAVPWVRSPSSVKEVLKAMTAKFAVRIDRDQPEKQEHGRITYALSVGFGTCYIDLSFMPTI